MGSARGSGCTYCESRLASIFCKSRQRNPLFIPPEQNFRAPPRPRNRGRGRRCIQVVAVVVVVLHIGSNLDLVQRHTKHSPFFPNSVHKPSHTRTHALHTHLSPPTPHFFSFVADLDHVLNLILVLVFVLPKKISTLVSFF